MTYNVIFIVAQEKISPYVLSFSSRGEKVSKEHKKFHHII